MRAKGAVRLIITSAVVVFALAAWASPALAAGGPWWHVGLGARPSVLNPGGASDGVQDLTISATAGEVLISNYPVSEAKAALQTCAETGKCFRFEEFRAVSVPYDVGALQLQEAVETEMFPSREVTVTGGPGDVAGDKPYVITFPDQRAPRLFVNGDTEEAEFGRTPLSGGKAEGAVSVVSEGRSDGVVVVSAANLGNAATAGEISPVVIADKLPAGLRAVGVAAIAGEDGANTGSRGPVSCVLKTLSCSFTHSLPSFERIEMLVEVVVESVVSGAVNEASVSGGGALHGSTVRRTVQIGSGNTETPFGVQDYEEALETEGGTQDTQAGSHPFQFTTTISANENAVGEPAVLTKDLKFNLPAGLVGNPTAVPRCSIGQFLTTNAKAENNLCPAQSAIGVAVVTVNEPGHVLFGSLSEPGLFGTVGTFTVPVFNLEPSYGEPARFGMLLPITPVFVDTSLRTGSDYGLTGETRNLSQTAGFLRAEVTFWGVPGDPSHDRQRGWECLSDERKGTACPAAEQINPPPFMVLPTLCDGPLQTSVIADSWNDPASKLTYGPNEPLQAMDGCNQLQFEPSMKVTPDGSKGSSPTGMTFDAHVPQESMQLAKGHAEAAVKGLTVTLPKGVVVNPASADGLQVCSIAEISLTSGQAPGCPDASKVATVKIKTPLLSEPLEGAVYLAEQNANPFGSLIAMYMSAENAAEGIRVKAAGELREDPVTGQLTAHFERDPLFEGASLASQYLPPVPFEDVELHFFGGERAPLGTPAECGSYTTAATFIPWSAEPGEPPRESFSTFNITSGPNNAPCASPLPFAPTLTAGTTNINAGGFSPLTTTISREDGNQDIQTVQLHMPPGLSGVLKGVPLCPEAQANAGTCSAESLIGHTIVSVGLGNSPFSVTGGQVFLTEKYAGGQFGLSIVNPAVAGPFNLGKVIVRAKIEVDPHTAQLTVTTGQIPHILDGIPLQIKHVNVTIDRPGFIFNPTNCDPMSLTGTIGSVQDATAPVSVPFQVTNCAALPFSPKFSASIGGRPSRRNGESLHVKIVEGVAGEANVHLVKVELPKQLPSRLTTLQKACLAATFNANPGRCPAGSIVGHAKAVTSILPVPLEGPAYFVSHGGEAFPDLVVVLQGYGVTVDLVGSTHISKAGVTSSTFKTVPDQPVTSFELTLPQGPFSALAANGNPCTSKLAMPTEVIAQNGATIHQSTPIAVTGCAPTRAQKLAAAVKACNKKPKVKRAACQKAAHRKFRLVKKK
jgi:hypothetical protein